MESPIHSPEGGLVAVDFHFLLAELGTLYEGLQLTLLHLSGTQTEELRKMTNALPNLHIQHF